MATYRQHGNSQVAQWTKFWKALNVNVVKRQRTLKNYKRGQDFTTLKQAGVSRSVAEQVFANMEHFNDPLFFHKFSTFFKRDPETVKLWLNATTREDAFIELSRKLTRDDISKTKRAFLGLDILFKLYAKGDGRKFVAVVPENYVITFHPKSLIQRLNTKDTNARYKPYGVAEYEDRRIYCIAKDSGAYPVYKFITIRKMASQLFVTLSMDSSKEYNIAKSSLQQALGSYLDTPQTNVRYNKLETFLETGNSKHFLLMGVTYFDHNYRVSISDMYNRPENVSNLNSYKRKIKLTQKKQEIIIQIRIFLKDKTLKPITLRFLSYRTAGIIGAIKIESNDRKLSLAKRKILHERFLTDFAIPLNEFLQYADLGDSEIFRIFLQNQSYRPDQFELRSPAAIGVYKNLLKLNLVSEASFTEDHSRFCVNKGCSLYYKIQWNRKNCSHCGQILINGKRIETKIVDEQKVVDYFIDAFLPAANQKLTNTLLKTKLYIAKSTIDNDTVEFIALNKSLSGDQLTILKHRYPNVVVITGRDNLAEYEDQAIPAISLHSTVYEFTQQRYNNVKQLIEQAAERRTDHLRRLYNESRPRMADPKQYAAFNRRTKNLGAELFEADCSAILQYIFGNCIWLGAKYRGKKVPDGFTAFPLHDQQQGCFIWDGKYGEGRKVQMGKFDKNVAYIAAAKTNASIKANGGLKGFVFISNLSFPKSFATKYKPLLAGSRIQLSFMTAGQLFSIAKHFRRYESFIFNNEQAKSIFLDSMHMLLLKKHNGNAIHIIEDSVLESLLDQNTTQYNKLKEGRALTL
jgi:hypothetical protein